MKDQFRNRGSIAGGGAELDESLKPIDNAEMAEMMREDCKTMSKVMDEVNKTKPENAGLEV